MNKYLVTVSEETRSAMLRVLRKMLECFETAGDKVGGLPSEVSIAVVMWLKQLLEDMFDEVTPASSFGSFAATTSDEDEEEKEEFVALRYANKYVPSSKSQKNFFLSLTYGILYQGLGAYFCQQLSKCNPGCARCVLCSI